MIGDVVRTIGEKFWQHSISIITGFLIAMESSVPYFVPCMLVILLDVYSATQLNRRIAKKYPGATDGKFKSIYGSRIFETMIMGFLLVILAYYVDLYVIQNGNIAVRYVIGIFIGYQLVSVLENWSSENDNKIAKLFQKILVNKAERHLDIDLSEFWDLKNGESKTNNENNK